MEERIDGLDIWDDHGHRVSCKGLEILEESSHAEEKRRCVIWYHDYDSRQGPVGFTLLQVKNL